MAMFPALFGLLLAALVSGQTVDISPGDAVRKVGDELIVICKVPYEIDSCQTVDISPGDAVRKVGDELIVICKVPYEIDSCRILIGGQNFRLRPGVQDEVVYTGAGLMYGECGVYIRHVKQEQNGEISCILPPQSGSIEVTATMRLTVAKAPEPLTLFTPAQRQFREGERFDAQCIVPNGRPAAKISWFLDDQPLHEGIHQPKIETDPETGMSTIRQNMTRVLVADDAGRRLACRAEHEALAAPMEATRQLAVIFGDRTIADETIENSGQTVDISPRDAVRKVGDELIVICKVPYEIDSCLMSIGGQNRRLRPGVQDEVVYTGAGLKSGECGVYIRHVKEEFSGEIICILPPQSGSIEVTATMRLTVVSNQLKG